MGKKKFKSFKTRIGSLWVFIFMDNFYKNIWNIGVVSSKSRRAAHDWYHRRKNKRARNANRLSKAAGIQHVRAGYLLTRKAVETLDSGEAVILSTLSKKRYTLGKYVERIGFIPVQQDGKLVWVLIVPESWEEQRRYQRTRWPAEKTDVYSKDIVYEPLQKSQVVAPYLTS
jgi:hypothetical protein